MPIDPERFRGEAPTIGTIEHSPVKLNDAIMIGEQILASDPDNFGFQLQLGGLNARWENLFGMKRIPLSYVDTVPDDVAKILGSTGPASLRKISGLLNLAAVEGKWPLEALDVRTDPNPSMENALVLIEVRLRASFDQTEIINSLGRAINTVASSLSHDEGLALSHRIFVGVIEPVVPPEPNGNLIK